MESADELTFWNYRVAQDENGYCIVEAYYDHGQSGVDRPDSITATPAYPWGESLPGMLDDYKRMEGAWHRPVIDRRDYLTENENSDAADLKPELRE